MGLSAVLNTVESLDLDFLAGIFGFVDFLETCPQGLGLGFRVESRV